MPANHTASGSREPRRYEIRVRGPIGPAIMQAFPTLAKDRSGQDTLLIHGPRDFIAELDLLTGQRLYATFVVTQAGSIIRVPRPDVKSIIEVDGPLGDLLVQTLFRRREALLLLRSGMQLIGSRYSPDTQRLREFAARNRLAFHWIDLDNDPVAPSLLQTSSAPR